MARTATKVRKKDTGEQGNGGQFGSVTRSDAEVAVDTGTSSPGRKIMPGLPQPIEGHNGDLYGIDEMTGTLLPEGSIRIEGATSIPACNLEDVDPQELARQMNLADPYAEARATSDGNVQCKVVVTADSADNFDIDYALEGHPWASLNRSGPDVEAERIIDAARKSTALNAARQSLGEYAELSRTPQQTPTQARAAAARELYREAAQAESSEAIDGLRDLGSRHSAAYLSFPTSDDFEDTSLLSAFPTYYDADGQEMDWQTHPDIENGPEYSAWIMADRDEWVVQDLSPSTREYPDLESMTTRTDHVFTYRCARDTEGA
ncbi:hypothetical protein [Brachybacterium kimchii]|uniref:Uncharacterized protein n=1 Tax=Brachybacterium kimchii TaxID=2942909 RepID=A0ABY4NAW3_9MICO|nr:hypothetical protein [Brachybacterium kimchii]UQN30515.1 hypothetical protein M4486_04180 [Brachybacterium kimchii]